MSPVLSVTAVAASTASTASTSSLSSRSATAPAKPSGPAAAPRSIGLLTPLVPLTRACSRTLSAGDSSGTTRLRSAASSAASTPRPPALPTMPSRGPAGSGWVVSRRAVSARSVRDAQAITPDWAKSASTPTLGAAAAAVCEAPARRPLLERPPTIASRGLRSANRRATRANFVALPNDSR